LIFGFLAIRKIGFHSENGISEKWLFGKLKFGKLDFGKLGFGKMSIRKIGIRKNGIRKIGFGILGGYRSNDKSVRKIFKPEFALTGPIIKVLGIFWDMDKDILFLNPKLPTPTAFTKRTFLQVISQYYDPLGWFSPAFVPAKSFLKHLWKESYTWDQPFSAELQQIATLLTTDLRILVKYCFPRQLTLGTFDHNSCELHIFVDASKIVYAYVAYICFLDPIKKNRVVRFVTGKTRVSPIQPVTIPRLELLAAFIGSKAVTVVRDPLKIENCPTFLWADSKCVLTWLLERKILQPFVQRRINEINKVPNVQFRYVPSAENPADIGSRGISAQDLPHTLWWTGPQWLYSSSETWPATNLLDSIPESSKLVYTTKVFATLRCSLKQCSTILPHLPKKKNTFLDGEPPSKNERVEHSAKSKLHTFTTIPKFLLFEVNLPITQDDSENSSQDTNLDLQNTQENTLSPIEPETFLFDNFIHSANSYPLNFDISGYNRLHKLLRIFAYTYSAVCKLSKKRHERGQSPLTVLPNPIPYNTAKLLFLYADQHIWFPDLIATLTGPNPPKFVVYNKFHIVMDEMGLLRLNNYLPAYTFVQDVLSPILLHPQSYLLRLILIDIHVRDCHSAISYSVAKFRRHYFVPKAQKILPQILRKDCLRCKKATAKPYHYPTHSAVPDFRLLPCSHPFSFTGVYIFGPFQVFDAFKERTTKKGKTLPYTEPKKRWVLIFTCLSTRGVYLISVPKLDTREIWTAFLTFFSDRGTPRLFMSDNAAQFVLLSMHLPKFWTNFMQDERVADALAVNGTQWCFTPAKAPWYGAVYERLIGVIKAAYTRTLGPHPVHRLTFQSTLKNLQVMINERPLCPAPDGVQQLAITPSHFLHANFRIFSLDPSESGKPTDDGTAISRQLIHFWKLDAEYMRKLWLEWKHSYLVHLRDKIPSAFPNAYRNTAYTPKIRDVVQVLDFMMSPGVYKLAKITNLEISADGQIRRAEIEFPNGIRTNRVIRFLAPLELKCMSISMKSLPLIGVTDKEKVKASQAQSRSLDQ